MPGLSRSDVMAMVKDEGEERRMSPCDNAFEKVEQEEEGGSSSSMKRAPPAKRSRAEDEQPPVRQHPSVTLGGAAPTACTARAWHQATTPALPVVRQGPTPLETTFMYCKPYLMNAPASDLLGLFEQLVTTKAAAGLAQQQPSHPQPPAPMHLCLLDYCRSKGWRIAPRQRALLQLDFGSWYPFSRGMFWLHGREAVKTRACHLDVCEAEKVDGGCGADGRPVGVTLRLGGRCQGHDESRLCSAGVELRLVLQEDWDGRRRIVGEGREVRCPCSQRLMDGGRYYLASVEDTAPREVTWKIDEVEAMPGLAQGYGAAAAAGGMQQQPVLRRGGVFVLPTAALTPPTLERQQSQQWGPSQF